LLGTLNSGSSDVTFAVLNGRGSDTQEAVWWTPRGGRVVIALGNSSDTSIQTHLEYSNGQSQTVDIAPHATEYLRVRPPVPGTDRPTRDGTGESVRMTTVGPSGSLKATGLILASGSRLVSSIRFCDTKGVAQQHLFATNMRLGDYQPRILLKNTSAAGIVTRPRFFPSAGDSGNPVELSAVTLLPEEIVELDLSALMSAADRRTDLKTVSVQILNSGAPGSLIGAIFGVEQGTGATYDLPLRDSGTTRANTGAYPWRIDGDFNTIVSITNVGNTPSRYIAEIYYPGGRYLFGDRGLAVGETASFDLRKIRDEQLPDANGDLLPRTVTSGQFRWHWFPAPGTPQMIGRAAVSSPSRGISISYSCQANCYGFGPEYRIGGNTTVLMSGYETMSTKIRWYGSSGGYYDYNTTMSGGQMDNTSIASLDPVSSGWLNVNGLGVGDTYWSWIYSFEYDYDNGFDCERRYEERTDTEPAQVTCTKPTGETTSPTGWADSNNPSLPTVQKWMQTLTPSSVSFSGRTVKQFPSGTGTDDCWFLGSDVPKHLQVSEGQSWTVNSDNTWGPDGVGWPPFAVNYYRSFNRHPCSTSVTQRMDIYCGLVSTLNYKFNTLEGAIGSTTVSSTRNGQTVTRTWP
jgi:hypothetical protein